MALSITQTLPASPSLELRQVSHAHGVVEAVRNVSLTIAAGEIVCLVGPSGCGKSTLLRVAAGLEELQAGEVWIGGRMVAGAGRTMPPERRGIGLVFQDYALFPHLSVLDNVRFGLAGLAGERQRKRALDALARVGMADFAAAYPHMLSGGEQQRVALARALAPEPRVILLDEPFSGLDVGLRGQVRDQTLHVLEENGAATLVVTHDPEEAMFLADRIALMRDGRIVQDGPPAALYMQPETSFAAGFFGEVNRLAGTVVGGTVATQFGSFAAPGMAEGAAVELLIRPEAVIIGPAGGADGVIARVEASRLLGRTSLVHMRVEAPGGPLHLHARRWGLFLPDHDSLVTIRIDRRQAFVFPRAS